MAQNRRNWQDYWSWGRIVALLTWAVALVGIPWGLEFFQLIPEDTWIVPFTLLLAALFPILIDNMAFTLGTSVTILSATLLLYQPDFVGEFVDGLNFRMQDTFFNIRGPQEPTGQVVVVDIDNKSLEELGQWPWPRSEVAKMVRNMHEDGARVIGFDIVFAEPDRMSLEEWVTRFRSLGIDLSLSNTEGGATLTSIDGLQLPAEALENVALQDWEERLSAADPEFWVDPELGPEERRQLIIDRYLAYARQTWEDEQSTLKERHRRAGLAYEVKPFSASDSPIQDMIRRSDEQFYLMPAEQGVSVVGDNDFELARAFHEARVVAGGLFITPTSAGSRIASYRKEEAREESPGMVISSGIKDAETVFRGIRKATEQVLNLSILQDLSFHQGMFNIVPDRSGSARYYTMLMQAPVYQQMLVAREDLGELTGDAILDPDNYESKIIRQYYTYPSLALEMLRRANGYEQVLPLFEGSRSGILLRRDKGFQYEEPEGDEELSSYFSKASFPFLLPTELFIPLDFKADLPVNFLGYGGKWQPENKEGPSYYMPYVSAVDVAQGTFEPGTFEHKYVVIGSTDATLSDLVGSPFRPAFPGLEVHATMLDNLIAGDYLVEFGESALTLTFIFILVGGTLVSISIAWGNAWVAGLLTTAIMVGMPAFSYYIFAHHNLIIDFVYPMIFFGVLAFIVTLANYFFEGRERRFVASQFEKMVSPDVLAKVHDDPEGVSLKGQRSELSVLFSDLQGFTNISEALTPEKLVELLNDYLTPMSDIIMDKGGFIDKFMGDAIMAAWGVPFSDADHALKACQAAVEQQKKLEEIRPIIKEKYGVDLYVRIGIGSGVAAAAMMGSESRKNYTVMGDVVNLAARLEPACKDYGIFILISENTYEAVKDHVHARCVDRLVVKGKSVPIPVYELMGLKGDLPNEEVEKIQLFESALESHWERDWDNALTALRTIEELDPGDGPTHNLSDRIKDYQMHPPAENWQGEYIKNTK